MVLIGFLGTSATHGREHTQLCCPGKLPGRSQRNSS